MGKSKFASYTEDCGYLNPNKTCNCTGQCEELGCIAIESNFKNVEEKAYRMIKSAQGSLAELRRIRELKSLDEIKKSKSAAEQELWDQMERLRR
jgi:hypothetical protein